MEFVGITIFGGVNIQPPPPPAPPGYFIGLLGNGNGYWTNGAVTADSSGNMYITGYSESGGYPDFIVAKYNSAGAMQWQTRLSGAGRDYGAGIAVGSSGDVYVVGTSDVSGTNDILLAKYNSSGTIQWQRKIAGDSPDSDYGRGIALDSSDNVYITGKIQNLSGGIGVASLFLAKYNSSGTIQWQNRLNTDTNQGAEGYGVAIDSSGNIYVAGYDSVSTDMLIAKYDTSGTIQWQRRLGGTGTQQASSIAVDSSNNVYVTGYWSTGASLYYELVIAKYNTSGTLQWQNKLGSSSNEFDAGVATDSSSNVYVIGYSNAGGTNDIIIAKYNTSGTIQWQRKLNSGGSDISGGISIGSSGDMYITGTSDADVAPGMLFARLPTDGTKTGTYTVGAYSFTYAVSTLTEDTSTLTSTTSTLASASSPSTSSTSTLTSAASSLTSTVTVI